MRRKQGSCSEMRVRLTGVAPLIVHNIRLANKLDDYARRISRLTSKRSRTEAEDLEISHIEWEGGFYFDEKLGPCIPGANIKAMMRQGATAIKRGAKRIINAGMQVVEDMVPIQYEGPRKLDKMWEARRFTDVRLIKIKGRNGTAEAWCSNQIGGYREGVRRD